MARTRRRALRLGAYDYSWPGAYFVTVCTAGRVALFGPVVGGNMQVNHLGAIVTQAWLDLPRHYSHVALDAFVVMPNHVHGIIVLQGYNDHRDGMVGAGLRPAPTATDDGGDELVGAGLRPAPAMNNDAAPLSFGEPGIERPGPRPAHTATDSGDAQPVGAGLRPVPTAINSPRRHALPEIVRAFKSFSARRVNEFRNTPGAPFWQRNYYEHVVRSERDLADIRVYIRDNPARWTADSYYSPVESAG